MLVFKNVSNGNSYFKFISEFWLAQEGSNDRAFHRICTLMRKMGANTAIIENLDESDSDVKIELNAISTRLGAELEYKIFKISFCHECVNSVEQIKNLDPKKSFIASTVILNYRQKGILSWYSYVFKAIVSVPKRKKDSEKAILNNYIHNTKSFDCEILISATEKFSFSILGTFFCQQNTITSVCAHAALCMSINNIDISSGLITPEHINKILSIDHVSKKLARAGESGIGINIDDIINVLENLGLSVNLIDFFAQPNEDYAEYLYRYIESKCPTLLIFSTLRELHIIPIVGHTLNSDMWRPEAELAYSSKVGEIKYWSASAWVDHFIIHDDNFGMYSCLPVDSLRRITLPKFDPSFRAVYALAITPKNALTPAREAEWASIKLINGIYQSFVQSVGKMDFWNQQFLKTTDYAIARTLLVKRADYLDNLKYKDFENNAFSEKEKTDLLKNLPDIFWLSEITLPDLYSANKNKLIDVFYRADLQKSDLLKIDENWLQIRIPGFLLTRKEFIPMSIKSHYPLFRHKIEHEIDEW